MTDDITVPFRMQEYYAQNELQQCRDELQRCRDRNNRIEDEHRDLTKELAKTKEQCQQLQEMQINEAEKRERLRIQAQLERKYSQDVIAKLQSQKEAKET